MHNLESLSFPLSASHGNGIDWGTSYTWPPKLGKLYLNGEINEDHPLFLTSFPRRLTHLKIECCPGLSADAVYRWLRFNKGLKTFEVADWSPSNPQDNLDKTPLFIPVVRHLSLTISCISRMFFMHNFGLRADRCGMKSELDRDHPLETLELTTDYDFTPPPEPFQIQPVMVYFAIARDLQNLRTFKVGDALGWWSYCEDRAILAAIYLYMDHHARIRGDTRKIDVSGVRGICCYRRIHSR